MKLVEDSWGTGSEVQNMVQLQSTLGRVQASLQEWDRSVFGSVKADLARLRKELQDVRGQLLFTGPSRHERQLMSR